MKFNYIKKLFILIMVLACLCVNFSIISVSADAVKCSDYKGNNINANNYDEYSKVVNSYLYKIGDKYLRFQSDVLKDKYCAQFYDNSFKLIESYFIEKELELFGGFYADNDNFYILSGQKNSDKKPDAEVFRITKYNKDFKRLSATLFTNSNTVTPFVKGSARFVKSGKYLIIRTSHEFVNGDNKSQSNVTIQLNTDDMSIPVAQTDGATTGTGYVINSYNQLSLVDNGKFLSIDHSINNPRAILMFMYHSPIESGDIFSGGCEMSKIFTFEGNEGEDYTGVSVGGFEYSESSYLVAYNSVKQDENFASNKSRDIYVGVFDKSTKTVTTKTIATNTDGGTFSTPQLVKITDNEFVLLWSKENSISYVKLDGKGNKIGDIYTKKNVNLSDCKPIVSGDKLVWYEYKEAVCIYHSLDTKSLGIASVTVDNGHVFEVTKEPTAIGGKCTLTCRKCAETKEISTLSKFTVSWSNEENGKYSSSLENNSLDIGQKLFYKTDKVDRNDIDINISDITAVTVSDNSFTFNKVGSYIITFTYKYNSLLKKAFTIKVSHIDSNCDSKCDNCKVPAEPTHSFDNDCDENCNYCDYKRKTEHIWKIDETKGDYVCSVCRKLKNKDVNLQQDNTTSSEVESSSKVENASSTDSVSSVNSSSSSSTSNNSISQQVSSITSSQSVQLSSQVNSGENSVGISSSKVSQSNSSQDSEIESGSLETSSDKENGLVESGLTSTEVNAPGEENNNEKSPVVVIIVIAVIIVLAITGFFIWYFIFFKKK